MVIGLMGKNLVKEVANILMEPHMKEIGKLIFSMVQEKNYGKMAVLMQEIIAMEENTDMENTFGIMDANILGCGKLIICKEKDYINGMI